MDKEFDNLDLRFCGMLRSVDWWLATGVSGPTIGVIFKGQAVLFGHSKTNSLISV